MKKKSKKKRMDLKMEVSLLRLEESGLAHIVDAIFGNLKKMDSEVKVWPFTKEVEYNFHIKNRLDEVEHATLNALDNRGIAYVREPEDGWPAYRFTLSGCSVGHRECIILTIEVSFSKRDWKKMARPKYR